jgi:hypothetical protein
MRIEGNIVDVFESWPLQLAVEADTIRCHVSLAHNTSIIFQGRPASPQDLKTHRRIRIEGEAAGTNALLATNIEILS